jgi:agmatine deiminase
MGCRMPAEWSPQKNLWLAWPTDTSLWPDNHQRVLNRLAQMIAKISQFTPIKLLCALHSQQDATDKLKNCCTLFDRVEFVDIETDDVWCRDFGPIFIEDETSQKLISNWQFNAWGEKYPNFKKDNEVPSKLAQIENIKIHNIDIILEGGAIDVNGQGLLITTEEVLLNQNRNPQLTKQDYEEYFKKHFGIQQTIWLKKGLHNDDTDGHIDNVARFLNEGTIAMASEENLTSPDYEALSENISILTEFNKKQKTPLEIIKVPLPDPVMFNGNQLPASHLNFLITNELILIPTFNSSTDQQVIDLFQIIYPTKTVEGFDSSDFLQEGGAIHCLSQQQPL